MPRAVASAFIIFALAGVVISALNLVDISRVSTIRDASETDVVALAARLEHKHELPPSIEVEIAEKLGAQSAENASLAATYLRRALAKNENKPFAWAYLAYLESRIDGELNEASATALKRSIELCPLCDPELLKWRLEFVLFHWDAAEEGLRVAAFEGADVLRWWYLEYDYLDDVRDRSEQAGIPFSLYQRKVGSNVRPNEIPSE